MSIVDQLYHSLTLEQKNQITLEEFGRAILQMELEKLRDMGLFNTMRFTPEDARDLIYNKVLVNFNNLAPNSSHRCMHSYCRSKDIKASHVLSAAALRLISGRVGKQSNVLYTPIADMHSDQLRMVSLGVNKAFRFPGFCEKHENWFDFEKEIDIVSDTQAYKQVFRSICYDQFLQELFSKQEITLSQLILERVKEKAAGLIKKHSILEIELTLYHNQDTKNMLKRLKRSLKRTRLLLQEYRSFKKEVWKTIRSDEKQVFLWHGYSATRIPIALSHCGELNITKGKKEYRLFGTIILMPVSSGSSLLVCTPKKYNKQINYLLKNFKQKGYLEHFILRALADLTDNWLVKPEFWNNELQGTIKEEILRKRKWKKP